MGTRLRLPIEGTVDVQRARRETRALAVSLGFSRHDQEAVVLAVSELGMNLVRYGENGTLTLSGRERGQGPALHIRSLDRGPGIRDLALALQDGYSTGGGLGYGLPAVRRLMDGFSIKTSVKGTRITACKWKKRASS